MANAPDQPERDHPALARSDSRIYRTITKIIALTRASCRGVTGLLSLRVARP